MTQGEQQPVEQEVEVGPAPVPVSANAQAIPLPDGTPAVMVSFTSYNGVGVYFLPRDGALEFASMIRKAAQTGPQGIVVPKGAGGLVVPR
jgi:hypothetical protein